MDIEVAKTTAISLSIYLGFVQTERKYSNCPESDLVYQSRKYPK